MMKCNPGVPNGTFGEITFTFGEITKILGFRKFFVVAGGVGGLCG